MSQSSKQTRLYLLVFSTITLVISAFFAKYGFFVNGTLEEYDLLYFATFNLPPEIHNDLRPTLRWAYMLGAYITPQSPLGLNLVHFAVLIVQGIVVYMLGDKLRLPAVVSLATAVLCVVSPLRHMLLRFVAIQLLFTVFLLAIYFAFRYQDKRRAIWLILMVLASAFSSLGYEVTFAPMIVVPLLFWWREGALTRNVLITTAIWYITPLITGIRYIVAYITIDSYQSTLFTLENTVSAWLSYIAGAFVHASVGMWLLSVRWVYNNFADAVLISFVTALIVGGLLYWLAQIENTIDKDAPETETISGRRWGSLLVICAILFVFGFLVFLPTGARTFLDRTFSYSTWGASLAIVSVVYLLCQRLSTHYANSTFSLLMVGFVFLSLNAAYHWRNPEVSEAYRQQQILSQIIYNVPELTGEAPQIIIFDEPIIIIPRFGFSTQVETALRTIYEDPNLTVFVCYPGGSLAWFLESCMVTPDGIEMTTDNGIYEFAYDETLFLRYTHDELIVIEDTITTDTVSQSLTPQVHYCADCNYPPAVDTFFMEFPFTIPAESTRIRAYLPDWVADLLP
ncbi:MAG: hypothetical protein AAFR81_15825 [Chloroflexota bacterium]